MKRAGYHIVAEVHETTDAVFLFAIRRGDGSLVFRTETDDYAEEILARLLAGEGRA